MARTVVRRRIRAVIIGAAHAIAADAAERVHALLEARVVAARGAAGAGIHGAPRIVIGGLRMADGRGGKNGGGDDGGLEQAHATSPGDEPSSHLMNTARLRLISPNQGAPAWALPARRQGADRAAVSSAVGAHAALVRDSPDYGCRRRRCRSAWSRTARGLQNSMTGRRRGRL